jgi:molybdate-binding protein
MVPAQEGETRVRIIAVNTGARIEAIVRERFDLLVDRRAWFTEPVQRLAAFMRSDTVAAKAAAFGGYDVSDMGKVRWLSP